MKNFDAIIFDMDGLLLNSERIFLSCFQQTCDEFDVGDKTELFIQCIGTNSEASKKILSSGLGDNVDFINFIKTCRAKYHQQTKTKPIPLKPGVIDLLNHINSLQLPVAIATSTQTDSAIQKLENAGIKKYFNKIIGGEQVSNSKPLPDIYLEATNQLKVNSENCLALEDSENGVKSALAAGLTVIQIPDLVKPSDSFKQTGHIILQSLNDVITFEFKKTA